MPDGVNSNHFMKERVGLSNFLADYNEESVL